VTPGQMDDDIIGKYLCVFYIGMFEGSLANHRKLWKAEEGTSLHSHPPTFTYATTGSEKSFS
jgi:hypothetical protein